MYIIYIYMCVHIYIYIYNIYIHTYTCYKWYQWYIWSMTWEELSSSLSCPPYPASRQAAFTKPQVPLHKNSAIDIWLLDVPVHAISWWIWRHALWRIHHCNVGILFDQILSNAVENAGQKRKALGKTWRFKRAMNQTSVLPRSIHLPPFTLLGFFVAY